MSTAVYIEGASSSQQILFSFGEGVDLNEMYDEIRYGLDSQGFQMVGAFLVTSSEYLDVDLEDMIKQIQREMMEF